jgi:hypothetical protein
MSVGIFLWLLLLVFPPAISYTADPKIIEAAKKEGELHWWSTIAQDQSQKIIDEFMKLYPFIKANYWRSGVEPSPPRLIKGFKRVVLHPEKAQDAQESLKLYREIFGLP